MHKKDTHVYFFLMITGSALLMLGLLFSARYFLLR